MKEYKVILPGHAIINEKNMVKKEKWELLGTSRIDPWLHKWLKMENLNLWVIMSTN